MDTPTISINLEGFKATIKTAMVAYHDTASNDLQVAIDDYCTPERLQELVRLEAKRHIDTYIREAVDGFFRYGTGKRVILDAVHKKLELEYGVPDEA